ncbi:MAG: FCD domain-containing protein, partial [Lentisphaeria bacterium]
AVGIIEMKVGKGIFVADFSLGGVLERYHPMLSPNVRDWQCLKEARLAIELGIVELAAERATPEDVDQLRAVIAKMEKTRTAGKMRELDIGFHQTLAQIARSPLLTEFSGVLRKFFMLAREGEKMAGRRPPAETQQITAATHREHHALVAAIAAGDKLLARKRISEHLAAPTDLDLDTRGPT